MSTPAQIGSYVVERELGRGGAGIVYLAMDANLDRKVAIKALPPEVSGDPERLKRLEREAKTLASLNQRNIATIYGFEREGHTRYLILEFVDGESLDVLLESGAMTIPNALECARQIADGLEAAHERGVVHRDLKPANLMRRKDGIVKILDFGLAKEVGSDGIGDDSAVNITSESSIVGTPAYLSPEQIEGRPVDRRADIWGFGCTLYELLTARRVFTADNLAEMLRRILEEEPDFSALPSRTPLRIRELLERCLEKNPRVRLRDIGDARVELERALATRSWTGAIRVQPKTAPGASHRARVGTHVAAGLVGALAVGSWVWGFRATDVGGDREPPSHFTVHATGAGETLQIGVSGTNQYFRVSPDGRTLAFLGQYDADFDGGENQRGLRLFVRSLDDYTTRAVEQSEGATRFDFSPDGRWLCMVAPLSPESSQLRLAKVPVDGSAPPTILAPWKFSVAWMADGTIIGGAGSLSALRRVSADGSTPEDIPVDLGGIEPAFPLTVLRALPDRQGVFVEVSSFGEHGYTDNLAVFDLESGKLNIIVPNAGCGSLVADHLLFTRHDRLLAVAVDRSLRVVGDPVELDKGLRTPHVWAHAWFDVSQTGTLIYLPGGLQGANRWIGVVQPDGTITPWSADRMAFDESMFVALDGSRFAVTRSGTGGLYEIWGSELDPPRMRALVTSPRSDCGFAVVSSRGEFLLYDRHGRDGQSGIYRADFDGSKVPELVLARGENAINMFPTDIAPGDGSFLFWQDGPEGGSLWLRSLDAAQDQKSIAVTAQTGPDSTGRFSPDGRWIAYTSVTSGRFATYVRSFDPATLALGPPTPVPATRAPKYVYWSKDLRDGQPELLMAYYDSLRRFDGIRVRAGNPVEFSTAEVRFRLGNARWRQDDPLPGDRVLAILPGEEEVRRDRLRVVTNWFTVMRARLAGR